MNKLREKWYLGDSRYEKVVEQMQLLGIQDVTTMRQHKNGTVVWQLPIKYSTHPKFIEVASFKTGYVRNQNGGYTNYQLNKRRESEPRYYELPNGTYNKYTTKSCVLIPNEIDRLEYLIAYCLKNYYIKNANQVINGDYVSKWEHEYMLENANSPTVTRNLKKISESNDRIYELESQVNCGDKRIIDLKNKLEKVKRECNHAYDCGLSDAYNRVKDLEVEVELLQEQLAATKVRNVISVIVNGHRYKVL